MKIEIPCAYQGGKQRIAADIVNILLNENKWNEETMFYDLCCGSGSISIELVNRGISPDKIVMLDASVWGLFWKMIGEGSFDLSKFKSFIDTIPKEITMIKDYALEIINQPVDEDAAYKFLFLQACSFGSTPTWIEEGKWKKNGGLRNYWLPTETSNRKSPVNPMMPMPNSLYKRVENIVKNMYGISGIESNIVNYTQVKGNSVIYIDPPYNNTHGYGYTFDIHNYLKEINHNKVYISEGYKMFENGHQIAGERKKGGINGSRKSGNEEWLNVYEGI